MRKGASRKPGKPLPGLPLHSPAHEFAQREELGIGDEVPGKIAFFFLCDKTGIEKHSKMFGNIALFHFGCRREFAYSHGFAHQGPEQLEARGFGEDCELPGGFLDLSVGHEFFLSRLHIANR